MTSAADCISKGNCTSILYPTCSSQMWSWHSTNKKWSLIFLFFYLDCPEWFAWQTEYCQRQCTGISEAGSQAALWVLPEHPNDCSWRIPQNPAARLWEGEAKWRGLCRALVDSPSSQPAFTPPNIPLLPSELLKSYNEWPGSHNQRNQKL